jgi:uncharacterized membrane protein YdjX (TVP38/TMEM64 family)
VYRKWLILIGYLAIAVFIILNKGSLIEWIKSSDNNQLFLILTAATLLALIPAIPFPIVSGLIGLKYGPVLGGLLNVIVSTTAAILFFLLVRNVFQVRTRRWLTKFERLERFTTFFEKNAFMAVLIARLIPIMPAPAVNAYSAVSNMKFSSYFVATLIGKIPVMFVFAWVGNQLFVDLAKTLAVIGLYTVFVVVVYLIYKKIVGLA